ncbi:MAG: hypothetical protein ABEH38_08560 [Flavobacteriales bacterium]
MGHAGIHRVLGGGLLIILLSSFFKVAIAQDRKSFPHKKEAYLEAIRDFMMDADRGKGKDLIDDRFTPVWNGDKISSAQRKMVYNVSDRMLQERKDAFPHFENYLLAVLSYIKAERSDKGFKKWNEVLVELLKGRNRRKFDEFLEGSRDLFAENIVYRSRSTKWKAETDRYIFKTEQGDPVIRFPDLTLKCYAKGDSSVIYNTQGSFYPSDDKWQGKGGKVTWERAGMDSSETYALLRDYSIRVRSPRFNADSVKFHNPYFDRPLQGELREMVRAGTKGKEARYPRFQSYDARLSIDGIVKGVDYEGGLTMQGAKLRGSGTKDQKAFLFFHRKGKEVLQLSSNNFSIEPDMISSKDARVLIHIEEDSITHPTLRMKFDRKERLLTLIRDDKGLSKTPYYNSYHKLDMYFEALYWNIDDPLMRMGHLKGAAQKKASFESLDYFSKKRYNALQGIVQKRGSHPLAQLQQMTDKVGSNRFRTKEFARHIGLPTKQVHKMILEYSTKGFVQYNAEEKWIKVREKTQDYLKAAKGKKDHDVILINSDMERVKNKTSKQNAQLSLLNYDLTIRGIKRIPLSRTQVVSVYPGDYSVTVKKNRNFTFSGVLAAAKMSFFGKKFSFEYDPFKVNLIEVDSARMTAHQIPSPQNPDSSLARVRSTIEDLEGTVKVSHPKNKSGWKDKKYHQYPIVTNEKRSKVFYDDNFIQGGAYDRSKFYFHMKPFKMDSLDDFDNRAIVFDGKFHSGGILPPFKEELTLQKDHSLGFIREAPKGGFPVYGAGARFDDNIKLSNDGLQGDGTISFKTAEATSQEFTFFPDSTTGIAQTFKNQKSPSDPDVPKVVGQDVKIEYVPQKDVLKASKREKPMSIYSNAKMHGSVELGKDGMKGAGRMSFDNADIMSDEFKFKHMTADADTANLDLSAPSAEKIAFSTHNVNAHLDFKKRKGEFKSNGENSFIEFPENDYICYMDKFNWYMDRNKMELEASEEMKNVTINSDLDLSGSNFYSTHPDQDSLNFMAPKAEYNISEKIIKAKEIPYIPVADARIAPDSGKITIKKNANIKTLENAKILANSITKYHTIKNARVDIKGKHDYDGSGDRIYKDVNGMTTPIHFRKIDVDSTGESYGIGEIPESKDFGLSPHFTYHGKVRLKASKEHLLFDGKVRLVHDCKELERNWANFESRIDPKNVSIPIRDSILSKRDTQITSGVVMNKKERSLYPAFLSKKKDTGDIGIIKANGWLQFDQGTQEFKIANKKKLKQESFPGNLVRLNSKSCQVSGLGRIDHGADLGQISFEPIGSIERNVKKDHYKLKSAVLLDFFMNENAIESMGEKIKKFPNLDAVDVSKGHFEYAMREVVGTKKTDNIISDLTLKGEIKDFPEKLEGKLFLTQLNMVWDPERSSFVSKGPIGIGTIHDQQIFRYVEGKVQIKKSRSGDELKIFLKLDKKNWYYFEYKRGVMQAVSSNDAFNKEIKSTDASDKKYDGDGPDYRYSLGTERKKIRFVNGFNQ